MTRPILILFWLAAMTTVAAQPAPVRWTVARPSAGQPDLEGIWNFAMLTPLERPREFAGREFLTDEEVVELERRAVEREDGRPPVVRLGGRQGHAAHARTVAAMGRHQRVDSEALSRNHGNGQHAGRTSGRCEAD